MIALEEAQARLLALATIAETVEVDLNQAHGRWARRNVLARRTQPAAHLSAMDGYAIRFADLPGPWRIIGESAAGSQFAGAVSAGDAIRIFTGAIVPDGADTVIVQEDVTQEGDMLRLSGDGPAKMGAHIRTRGGDFSEGNVVISAGQRLNPAHIGLAAMAGHRTLPVARRLQVALISTGDELVPPGTATAIDQIPSSNAPMLAALLSTMPVDVRDCGIVADNLTAMADALKSAEDCDIIVTLGGASVGDHDLVKPALEALGASFDFWKVAMRPGKPVMAGKLGPAIVLGLPGNPVSAYVTANLFLIPLIAHRAGAGDPLPRREVVRLASSLPANGARLDHIRARLVEGEAAFIGVNDSAMLAALASADVLIVRQPGAPAAEKGSLAEIVRLPYQFS